MNDSQRIAAREDLLAESRSVFDERSTAFHKGQRANLRICCFTEHANSMLMWSHYAAQHAGLCFQYATRRESKPAFNHYHLHPVIYLSERLNLTNHIAKPEEYDKRLLAAVAACVKAECWSYEDEWRFIYPARNKEFYSFGKPARIIAGSRISDANYEELLGLCDSHEIPLVRATLAESSFSIHIPEI